MAYITDNELYPPYKKETDFMSFVNFSRHADMIIHDAQYKTCDMPTKSGWGHSVAEEAVKLAMASKARYIALYSHDPDRTDNDIDELVSQCNHYIEIAQSSVTLFAAAEGQVITL